MFAFLNGLLRRRPVAVSDWIDIDELRRRLAGGKPCVLIDVRQPDEFTGAPGHLPGAINIPLAELRGRIPEIVEQARPVVLVCRTDRRSATAAAVLLASGLREVAVLRGGTEAWHQRGLPLD